MEGHFVHSHATRCIKTVVRCAPLRSEYRLNFSTFPTRSPAPGVALTRLVILRTIRSTMLIPPSRGI